jgi:prevent-host-death family protein
MCYSRDEMKQRNDMLGRIGIRQLRNDVSRIVQRARAGERIVISVDGIPAAEIGPLNDRAGRPTVDDLIASGQLLPRRTAASAPPAHPVQSPGRSSSAVLSEHRDR